MKRWQQRLLAFASARLRRAGVQLRRAVQPEIDDQQDERQAALAAARDFAASAALLRGGVAKIAQLWAYRHSADLGPEAQQALAPLWDHLPGEEPQAIRRVISEDLAAPPEALFAQFDPQPLAAASLGQVHAAVGHDGAALAVKVQYPGVAAALRDDLGSRRVLRQLVGGDLGGAVSEQAIATLHRELLRELDYVAEAHNLRRFRRAYAGDTAIAIPAVVAERSSGRVLTMERFTGRTLPQLAATGSVAERAAVARILFRFTFGAPLRHGLLNADPHPGNYLILSPPDAPAEETRVGFVDFGCVAELTQSDVASERRLWLAVIHRSGEELRHAAHQQGLINAATTFNLHTYRDWEQALCAPFLVRGEFQLEPAQVRALDELTWRLVHTAQLTLPPQSLLLWRQRLGALAVLASLRPRLPFRRLLADLLDDGSHPIPLLERYP